MLKIMLGLGSQGFSNITFSVGFQYKTMYYFKCELLNIPIHRA